jgi:hypothetical protein
VAIPHGNWDYHNPGPSKYFETINYIHVTTGGAHICFAAIVLEGCNLANGYINTPQTSIFT